MTKKNIVKFKVNEEKCIGCGKCTLVCSGAILNLNDNKVPQIDDITEFGWGGCWKCQHCLAVCPTGAISIMGKNPEDSLLPPNEYQPGKMMESLIRNRRACRRYLDKNVDKKIIHDIIDIAQNAPTGSNKQHVEYTVFDDKEETKYFRDLAYNEMERQAALGIYPRTFERKYYDQMKGWEQSVRPDMLLCSAPHLAIPHAPEGKGCWVQDVNIASSYFELLCAARGLGAIMMTFPLNVLDTMPKIKGLLKIPDNHYFGMIVGFGYPEIRYARGVQKEINTKINIIKNL